jgi:hypothetical protein
MLLKTSITIVAQIHHVFQAQILAIILVILSNFGCYDGEIVAFVYDIEASIPGLVDQL